MNEEEVIERLQAEVLQEMRTELVRHNLSRYIPYLMSKHMLSMDDKEEIEALATTRRQSDKIIDVLLRRGPKAYGHFCYALLDMKVEAFLVTKLNVLLERKKSEVFASQQLAEKMDTSDLPTPSSLSPILNTHP